MLPSRNIVTPVAALSAVTDVVEGGGDTMIDGDGNTMADGDGNEMAFAA